MKFYMSVILFVHIVLSKSYAGEVCNTCRDTNCLKEDIPQLDCTKFVPPLPFESQLIINDNKKDLKYSCLDLKYYEGDILNHIQQCIQTSDLRSFCSTLEYLIKIKECRTALPVHDKSKRSLGNNEFPEIKDEDKTPSTATETTDSSGTTATGAPSDPSVTTLSPPTDSTSTVEPTQGSTSSETTTTDSSTKASTTDDTTTSEIIETTTSQTSAMPIISILALLAILAAYIL